MHEINTAAEAITSAADPDANIIFGATIDDKLEGEVIITVVATGFDASYFAERINSPTAVRGATLTRISAKADEKDMRGLDVSLEDHESAAEELFVSDKTMPANIWTADDHRHTGDGDDSGLLRNAAVDSPGNDNAGRQPPLLTTDDDSRR